MDDLISRQAAIDAVKAYWKKVVDDIPKGVGFEELTQLCNMALEHNANILKAIDQLPSAQPEQPEQRWIPWDSDRLPEESGTYTVTAYDGVTERVTYAKYQKRLKRWELTGAKAYWRVLAWMPLPEPYRGEI